MKRTISILIVPTLALALSGCFIVGRSKTNSTSQPATAGEPKNHGQARSQEVHERNEARKEAKDAAKEDKKK
jgi:hypothetical protein